MENDISLGEVCNTLRVVWGDAKRVAEGFLGSEMYSRQKRIVQVLSSIAISIVGFCVTMPIVILLGGVFLGPLEGHAFFSTRDAILFLISIFGGLVIAVIVGAKYYRYLEKRMDQ